jgi:hypothetical protein
MSLCPLLHLTPPLWVSRGIKVATCVRGGFLSKEKKTSSRRVAGGRIGVLEVGGRTSFRDFPDLDEAVLATRRNHVVVERAELDLEHRRRVSAHPWVVQLDSPGLARQKNKRRTGQGHITGLHGQSREGQANGNANVSTGVTTRDGTTKRDRERVDRPVKHDTLPAGHRETSHKEARYIALPTMARTSPPATATSTRAQASVARLTPTSCFSCQRPSPYPSTHTHMHTLSSNQQTDANSEKRGTGGFTFSSGCTRNEPPPCNGETK